MKRTVRLLLVALILIGMMLPTVALAEWGTTTGSVNVRQGPDINAKVLGTLTANTNVFVEESIHTDDGRTWCKVNYYGQDGYISDKNLSFKDVSSEDEVYNVSIRMMTTADVNVRSKPDLESKVLFSLEPEAIINALAIYPTIDGRLWAEIDCSEDVGRYQRGYISMKYLVTIDQQLPSLGKSMEVTGGRVNIREQPLISAKDIGTIKKGTVLTIGSYFFSSDGRTWAYVTEGWERSGFVSCLYLKVAD